SSPRERRVYVRPSLGHRSFVVSCPLAPLADASYPVSVRRPAVFAPRFLSTVGRPSAVALRFDRDDLLSAGLAPARQRPCWAHMTKTPPAPLRGPAGQLRNDVVEATAPPRHVAPELPPTGRAE